MTKKGSHANIFAMTGNFEPMGAQKTIIYRLVIRNLRYGACFTFVYHLHYIYTRDGKIDVATTLAPNELGPPIQVQTQFYLDQINFSVFSGLNPES